MSTTSVSLLVWWYFSVHIWQLCKCKQIPINQSAALFTAALLIFTVSSLDVTLMSAGMLRENSRHFKESILIWCDVALLFATMLGWGFSCTLTSDLLLQVEYDSHSLMEDEQFSLGLLAFQVQLAHATQLLEGLIDVSHPEALTGVVSHPPLALTLGLLLRIQVLIFSDTVEERTVSLLEAHTKKCRQIEVSLSLKIRNYNKWNFNCHIHQLKNINSELECIYNVYLK